MSIDTNNKTEMNPQNNVGMLLWRLFKFGFWGWIALSALHAVTAEGININVKISSTAPVQIKAEH